MTSFMSEYIPEPGDIVSHVDQPNFLFVVKGKNPEKKYGYLLKKHPLDEGRGYILFHKGDLVLVERPPKLHKRMEELIQFISEILGDKKQHRELRTHEEIIYNKCQEILKEIQP